MGPLSFIILGAIIGMTARIAQKAGFSGWWGLIQIVPLAGVVMMWVLAFVNWPGQLPPGRQEENRRISAPD